jgi:hypothetical protein
MERLLQVTRGWRIKASVKLRTIFFLVLAAASPARAYELSDHKRITVQAVDELNACFPGLISETQKTALWTSDLEEDIDLIRKDLLYSHFFNPYKQLEMRRYDSSVRVARLQEAIARDEAEGDHDGLGLFIHLGHIAHHLQDMSVPPHVVPVMHWINDGFEKYDLKGDISSGLSCADLLTEPTQSPMELLQATAKATLRSLSELNVPVIAGSRPMSVSGDAFWKESTDNQFGTYGFLGNHFGEALFVEHGTEYAVATDFYARYKQQQMKLGTQATLQALFGVLTSKGD